jgi:transposase
MVERDRSTRHHRRHDRQGRSNNTAIKNIKRTARGYRNPANYKSVILLRSAARTAA